MLTQRIEKQSQQEIMDMLEFTTQLEQQFISKDKELEERIQSIRVAFDELEVQKVSYENDRIRAIDDLVKI